MHALGELGWVDAIVGGAIRAAGQVGSALITADAQRYVARNDRKTQLQLALTQERIAADRERAMTARTEIETRGTTTQVSTGAWALVAIAAVVLIAGD